MADLTETITVQGEGITVSRLIWRRFHRPMPGLVERVLDMNPGLADLGPYLPLGTKVAIPVPTEGTPDIQPPITLW